VGLLIPGLFFPFSPLPPLVNERTRGHHHPSSSIHPSTLAVIMRCSPSSWLHRPSSSSSSYSLQLFLSHLAIY
ncbi:hypothetical protein TorRG33x02_347380, partial [Trema orientale]